MDLIIDGYQRALKKAEENRIREESKQTMT